NPAVIGTFVPHQIEYENGKRKRLPSKTGPIEGYYPPIVDKEDFARVQVLAEDNPRRGKHAESEVRNVLAGIARCPLCEATMTLVNKGKGSRYLACSRAKSGAG